VWWTAAAGRGRQVQRQGQEGGQMQMTDGGFAAGGKAIDLLEMGWGASTLNGSQPDTQTR